MPSKIHNYQQAHFVTFAVVELVMVVWRLPSLGLLSCKLKRSWARVPGSPYAYLPPAADTGTPSGSVSNVSADGNSLSLDFSHAGKDPLTPGFLTPDLDVQAGLSFTEDLENGVLSIVGSFTGDTFPSAEAFIQDQSGMSIFLGAKKESGGLLNLFGENKNPLFKVNIQIQFDGKGNFTGVTHDGNNYTIDEWNKRVEEGF